MVTVSLTGTSREDAVTVFDVLRTAFPTDPPFDDVPEDPPGSRPEVWTADIAPADDRIPTGPAPLEGPVSATLQGGCLAVDLLREALRGAFAVQERGTASGDREKEVDLSLGALDGRVRGTRFTSDGRSTPRCPRPGSRTDRR
ncbi:hypothetical protein AB0F46_09290 [Streptomyces sp. NPDC026665]|uniref:hypothetical protein n=1 Tax=Streptomyces sp. NPDC026665 TaxID=3154798 RepID=UPI0034098497